MKFRIFNSYQSKRYILVSSKVQKPSFYNDRMEEINVTKKIGITQVYELLATILSCKTSVISEI